MSTKYRYFMDHYGDWVHIMTNKTPQGVAHFEFILQRLCTLDQEYIRTHEGELVWTMFEHLDAITFSRPYVMPVETFLLILRPHIGHFYELACTDLADYDIDQAREAAEITYVHRYTPENNTLDTVLRNYDSGGWYQLMRAIVPVSPAEKRLPLWKALLARTSAVLSHDVKAAADPAYMYLSRLRGQQETELLAHLAYFLDTIQWLGLGISSPVVAARRTLVLRTFAPLPSPPPSATVAVASSGRESAWQCPICLEAQLAGLVALRPCGHVFHGACASRLVAPFRCPECRSHAEGWMKLFM